MKTPTRQPVALTAATLCLALLTLGAVFPSALAKDARFVEAVTGAYLSLARLGAVEAAARIGDA